MQPKYTQTWDLQRYFYQSISDPQIDLDYNGVEKLVDDFVTKYKGKIGTFGPEDFLEFFHDDDQINHKLYKILIYLHLESSLDTQDQDIIKKNGDLELKLITLSNKLLFVSTEFKKLGYEKLLEYSQNIDLKAYHNYFLQKANNVKYLLDENTEKALNLKENSGANSFNKLYEELTNSFDFELEIDGQIEKLTQEEIRAYRMHENEDLRQKAYQSLNQKFCDKPIQITLGNTYSALVKDWTSELKIRGFKGVMSQRNIREEMPDKAVDMLFTEVEKRYDLYHRFLKIKHKLVIDSGQQKSGGDKLKSWNLLAPVTFKKVEYKFEDALELFLDTVKNFDSEIYDIVIEMFTQNRVDVYPKKNKTSGAFSLSDKGFDSFVLLNFTGKMDDVSTIAHELGHAVHGVLSQKQPNQVYNTSLCLAETASVFNEMLFAESFYNNLQTKEEKVHFLSDRIQDIFATIFTQIMYAGFEKEVHQKIAADTDLTYEDFNKLWRKHQLKLFGNMVEFDTDENQAIGWSTIPHLFRAPFYVYSYAFGNLLTFSLFSKYKQEGKKFVSDYKQILATGGGLAPYELLFENGIDITDPQFYQHGLNELEKMIIELENLVNHQN